MLGTCSAREKDLRKEHRALQRVRNLTLLQMMFGAWTYSSRETTDASDRFRTDHINKLQEALVLKARIRVDKQFRKAKRVDWKNWVQWQLEHKIAKLKDAKASEVYKILRPKKIIARKKGLSKRALPGLKDVGGNWCFSRQQVADAWEKQFAQIEPAQEVTFPELLDRSQAHDGAWSSEHLQGIPTIYDFEKCLMELHDAKAPGLDGIGAKVWQCGLAQTASRLYPLILKAALGKQHIVEWTGGWCCTKGERSLPHG